MLLFLVPAQMDIAGNLYFQLYICAHERKELTYMCAVRSQSVIVSAVFCSHLSLLLLYASFTWLTKKMSMVFFAFSRPPFYLGYAPEDQNVHLYNRMTSQI